MTWRDLSPTRSIRVRLTLVGSALLFATTAIGGLAFERVLDNELSTTLDQQLETQASDRAAAVDVGADPTTQLDAGDGESAVAIFSVDGQLLANRGFDDPQEVADLQPTAAVTQELTLVEADENEVELTDLRVAVAQSDTARVVVAAELDSLGSTLHAVRRLLLMAVPLVTTAAGLLLWFVVGRSLRPVEQIRRDAQSIAEVGAGGRVNQPENADELGRLASTMNDMLERLDASAATLRRFVSDSSHEIRSPIANIRARAETSGAGDWEAARDDIVGEVERIEAIVDDLTYLARSDEGRIEQRLERIELDDVMFAEAARIQRRGVVTVDASSVEPVVVVADASQVRRAVRNLVDNAERHARSTVVLWAVENREDGVELGVADDGPGIAEEDRGRIFERFARLDESRDRSGGGTGLGLAIVADIVERHGGSVDVSNAELGGARFVLSIPVAGPNTAEQ